LAFVRIFGSNVRAKDDIFDETATAANPTQHDPHGPDDPLKTFGHHCLHVLRCDEMAEQTFEWCCSRPCERFLAQMFRQKPF
jgi:hypothetical protein